jgi:protoheme IX farnesyltransferase
MANIKAYMQLVKFRLTTTVVATSVFGYLLGCKWQAQPGPMGDFFQLKVFLGVLFGGLLVVFASNGFNQLIEKEHDSKMTRTKGRPLVEERLSENEARIFSLICGILGLVLMAFTTNFVATLLSFISLVTYVFFYTPMKGKSPLAVMVGAIPGALPPLIGYTAVVGRIDEVGVVLFLVQFFWQFPHFWAIAWLLHDDYQKAGYWLLPSVGGRDKKSAYQVLIYTVVLILSSMMPVFYGLAKPTCLTLVLPVGVFMLWQAFKLFRSLDVADARRLLFTSFVYTPVVFIAYIVF